MPDDHLDTLIDEVAHAMTDTPPDAQLAHRVSMRIAGLDAPRERSRGMQSWVLVPAAGVCALLLAVVVVTNVARKNVRDNAVRLKPDTTEIQAPPVRLKPDTTSARGFQPRVRGPERAALQQTRPALLPGTLEPLQLDAIDVAPLALNHIDINPIAVDRIEISAMP